MNPYTPEQLKTIAKDMEDAFLKKQDINGLCGLYGDGVYEADVSLGLGISAKKELRLYGVDCPEMKFTHRLAGIVVRDYVRTFCLI
jgi:endonuclease YncB( thermonuclease family)